MALTRQCLLAGITRSMVYASHVVDAPDELELLLLALIDAEYTLHPFYGSRKMVVHLGKVGYPVNRKRVQRLMRILGLAGMAPGPNTSCPHPQHKIYPYLLRGVNVTRPNQVWSTDITYIRLPRGFAYLTAVIDWYSRKVLAWRLSNTLDSEFCVDCLEQSLRSYGIPDIFNTDQGCQFTSEAFTGVLKLNGIAISMDGRGRALDNIFVERLWRSVKHEDVYLKGYVDMPRLQLGLAEYFESLRVNSPPLGAIQTSNKVANTPLLAAGYFISTTPKGPINLWVTSLRSRSTKLAAAAEQESLINSKNKNRF